MMRTGILMWGTKFIASSSGNVKQRDDKNCPADGHCADPNFPVAGLYVRMSFEGMQRYPAGHFGGRGSRDWATAI